MIKIKLVVLFVILSISPGFGFTAKTTSYSGSEDGNYRTCEGKKLVEGMIAADLSIYKLGTQVLINGEPFVVADCGAAIRGPRHFDVYCKTMVAMRKRGTVMAEVKILQKAANKHPILAKSAAIKKFENTSCLLKGNSVYSSKYHQVYKKPDEMVCMEF